MPPTAKARIIARIAKDESGATAIEYGLLVALIVVVIIVAIGQLGQANLNNYNKVGNAVSAAIP